MRAAVTFALFLAACSGAPARPSHLPLRDRLDLFARELLAALSSGRPDRVRALQAPDAALEDLFEPAYVDVLLADRRIDRGGPDRIASQWRALAGARYAGYCARGVGPGTSSLPGLGARVSSIGELVLVARDAAGEWGGVVRDVVEIGGTYRFARWTIDAPRRNHFALEQWSCDFGRREAPP